MSMFLLAISKIQMLMFIAGHTRKTKLKITKKHKPYWHVIHFNTCHLQCWKIYITFKYLQKNHNSGLETRLAPS